MTDGLMYIPNDYTQNYPFCRLILVVETLNIHPNKPTNQMSAIAPKVVKPTNKKTLS